MARKFEVQFSARKERSPSCDGPKAGLFAFAVRLSESSRKETRGHQGNARTPESEDTDKSEDTYGRLRQPQTAHSFDAAFPGSDAVFGSDNPLLGTQARLLSALWIEVALFGRLLR